MSRIPQPPSSRTTKPTGTPTTPTTSTSRTTTSGSASRFGSPSVSRTAVPASSRIATSSSATRLAVPPSPKSRTASPTKSPTKSAPSRSGTPTARSRTQSTPRPFMRSAEEDTIPKVPQLSVKEAIALKRAEAKKAMAAAGASRGAAHPLDGLQDSSPDTWGAPEPEVEIGRWSVRETIERAQNTGSINLAARSLPCIPSALFEIHLGVKPEPLQSVPEEPPLPESGRKKPSNSNAAPSWYEQQDLTTLRAWNNEIIELQPEISLFGSLKNIDLHNNRLRSLPDSFCDLSFLMTVDLSHNALTSLPFYFFALPALTTLNLSHNALNSLPFNTPFSPDNAANAPVKPRSRSSDMFAPAVVRADTPLPKLANLNVSSNKISATAIDITALPRYIARLDLSENPLTSGSGDAAEGLIAALASLPKLQELHAKRAELDDAAFTPSLLENTTNPFPSLQHLDFEETHVSRDALASALACIAKELNFDVTSDDLPLDSPTRSSPAPTATIGVIVGKKIVREKWELEADRRAKLRSMRSAANLRQRSEAEEATPSTTATAVPTKRSEQVKPPTPKREVLKEQWEIDAEQGLLTEGGRRRARAQAALQEAEAAAAAEAATATDDSATSTALSKSKYWDARQQTLALPPLSPPTRGHGRGFSLASGAAHGHMVGGVGADVTLPTATLPLALIAAQSFADNLRVLELKGRRADVSFALPEAGGPVLPRLEELILDGCALGDEVPTTRGAEKGMQDTLSLLAVLFPSLRTLDLTFNNLTAAALTKETFAKLVLARDGRAGLKHLRLRGNRLANLDGLQELAVELFTGGASAHEAWKLEELDVRENSVEALGGELGLLPLDVFLVEGNVCVTFSFVGGSKWVS
ncbi:RNI-like protein [Auriscalpium vulgare]|uniref:RNI-like protein n=1 Tax=Auriscalpium vulgare TaxID=40419 RepID=A0ACB8RIN1_9AGAM|nr:RNI-like protein [Auriscalpium vulgare]